MAKVEGLAPAPLPGWPLDEDGAPMAMVTMQAAELVGLPNYSNITIGPASVTRFVRDTEESRKDGLKVCTEEVEGLIANERQRIQDILDGQSS